MLTLTYPGSWLQTNPLNGDIFLMGVLVTETNAAERLGAVVVLYEAVEKLSKLEVVWVDPGYSGQNFAQAVKQVCGDSVRVEVIERKSCII